MTPTIRTTKCISTTTTPRPISLDLAMRINRTQDSGLRTQRGLLLFMIAAFCVLSWPTRTLAGGPPVNPALVMPPGVSTMTVTYGDPGGTSGFTIDASTDMAFSGTILSSSTANVTVTTLTLSGLAPNTTYFIRAGALYGASTTYTNTVPAVMSTLASAITNILVYQVNASSITLNCTPFAAGT